jgi:DNA end-binding protein Ku
MPRPVWTGSISFGLVNVPIKLFPATESHRVAFHELEEGTGERVRYKRVAEGSGREVPWEKIQKGFALGKDRFVILTDEELRAAAPGHTQTVDIEQFVPLADIDPVMWDQTYYLAPDGTSAAKAYVLLRDAMKKDGRVAIGRFVMRTKEHLVCIRPFRDAMALQTMFFPDEVRAADAVVQLPRHSAASARELTLAGQLIESLAGTWSARGHEDTFRRNVLALVKKKERGEIIEVGDGKDKGKSPRVVDLMEALKATLAQSTPDGNSKRKPAARPRTSPAARAPRPRQRSKRSAAAASRA